MSQDVGKLRCQTAQVPLYKFSFDISPLTLHVILILYTLMMTNVNDFVSSQ